MPLLPAESPKPSQPETEDGCALQLQSLTDPGLPQGTRALRTASTHKKPGCAYQERKLQQACCTCTL